ncbi:phytochrome-like histidine kinase PHY1p [Teratosphaeria nubilosa]|uniref:Phytochrome-like histidine kinase PHY1p n=1 Tax=Teratosphaeria nubilosa TaxID=161662 RepID=A0A6G1LID0_9PEZI|nr:phytochrome-like histidine kinase PHY1p [Teratosphaeria nubilosa]
MSSDHEQEGPTSDAAQDGTPTSPRNVDRQKTGSSPLRPKRPNLASPDGLPKPEVDFSQSPKLPRSSLEGQLSPQAVDRVFPVRSVVSMDPTPTPKVQERSGYFQNAAHARRQSSAHTSLGAGGTPARNRQVSAEARSPSASLRGAQFDSDSEQSRKSSLSDPLSPVAPSQTRQPPQLFHQIMSSDAASDRAQSTRPPSSSRGSFTSVKSTDELGGLITARFKHVVTEGGHAIITGRDGETLQRCEDEPIHIPGAVQGFGLLMALEEQSEGRLTVRVVSENSKRLIGYTPKQLFALESFTDILSEEQADNLLDHVDFIRDEDADVMTNGPEVFTLSIRTPHRKSAKMWCAMHINDAHKNLIICEFELEDDPENPLVPPNDQTPEPPEDTLDSNPTEAEYLESTQNTSKPLRVLRSARKRKGEAAAMEVFNIMSQVQEQLAAAPNLESFLKILVGVVKELTGFHRVMIYQFDHAWNGRVVTELVDPRATKDLYKGLNFPASDIPKQARDLYKINKVRMLYDRDQDTARLVCRTMEDLERPLDLTYSYLRAMSPIHLKYLANMAVRSSMSISINAFDELWGLIACHTYGSKGMRVSFPIRKMCRLVGDSASRNIERLSYASRLQARKLINTVPTQKNPSGYIIASSEDLLKLFDADFGLLSIRDETKILGNLEQSQEALAMLEYLRMRSVTNVMTSMDITEDFPDLRYAPGFSVIAGLLIVPLSSSGADFIVFFRKGQLKEVKWAGNPYEKFIKEGTEGYLEPRKSFKTWSETVVGKCREWTEEEIETAAVLCLVYGKFIEVWRQKEAALQNSQLTRLLLANSAHEVRTPLNAIINYLEIALEGSLDQETRENLAKSHSASKSLIYVINDLLDLTKTEEGADLTKDEIFDLKATLLEATDVFKGDAKRKGISYTVSDYPGLPTQVIGDQRRVRQAISNVTANAIQNTTQGGVTVDMYLASQAGSHVEVEICVADSGVGMNSRKLDALFRELEQVQTEADPGVGDAVLPNSKSIEGATGKKESERTLGLGLAVVARIVRNMNGQLRLKSEEGKGSRFVIVFPFDLPDTERTTNEIDSAESSVGSMTPHVEQHPGPSTPPVDGEVTLIDRGSARHASTASGERRQSALAVSRRNSGESMNSKRSIGSVNSARSNVSFASNASGKSEADRLIEAISHPHAVHGHSMSRSGSRGAASEGAMRPSLVKRHTSAVDEAGSPLRSRAKSAESAPEPQALIDRTISRPGEHNVEGQGQPVRPIRVPEGVIVTPGGSQTPISSAAAECVSNVDTSHDSVPDKANEPATADHMRVLVAEDDPVNSRIIKKRLEKLGHEVFLTVNGEECASTYGDKSGFFDIVLMDMQMPIVDGLTSTKMIRSFEKSHPSHLLSTRASLNGRVPIIAVSASLQEKDRQSYVQAGFDGWILKPISFNRLSEIMTGIVDPGVRKDNIYKHGGWEHGGWFEEAQQDVFTANTVPSQQPPTSAPGHEADSDGVKIAAAVDDPGVKEEGESEQSQEQQRMLAEQEQRNQDEESQDSFQNRAGKAASLPELGSKEYARGKTSPDSMSTITQQRYTEHEERHASPTPMTPDQEEQRQVE